MLDLLSELIRIPSINPSFVEGSSELPLALFIRDWLQAHKIEAHIEEVLPGRPNVFAELGEGDKPVLCLCAHLDTVGVQEMIIPPFEPTIKEGRMYGRGSCDMKGGLAAVLQAAVRLSEQGIPGKLILALVCDEEYSSIGADDFVKKHKADACILTEPSDLKLVLAHKGFIWGKITTFGKSAHGSRSDIGISAISKIGPILTGLNELEILLNLRRDDLTGPASMHVSLIQGGNGISTYASTCKMHIERRTLPFEKEDEVKKELEDVIYQACPDAQVEWYFSRPAFQCNPDEKIVKCVEEAHPNVSQIGWGIWTDAAIFQQAGIPTVNIGPIGFGLHEPIESVDIDSIHKTADILFDAANSFFNTRSTNA